MDKKINEGTSLREKQILVEYTSIIDILRKSRQFVKLKKRGDNPHKHKEKSW